MTKTPLAMVVTLAALAIAGCASRDYRRKDFVEERSRCVGTIFDDAGTWWCRWQDAVARRSLDEVTDEYEIAPARMGKCRWIYSVDRASRRVMSWRFASGEKDCYTPIDWLGAW